MTFFGRDFVVTPDVLIPRLETESLVRKARSLLQPSKLSAYRHTTVIDIGCGSGIIGTSVADLADEVIFLDISPEALSVAKRNFRTYFPDKQAQFIVSDLLEQLPLGREYREAGRDLVSEQKSPLLSPQKGVKTLFLTNLPYIRADDWEHMSPDTVHEPKIALFGGESTGFELYERLFDELSLLLVRSETREASDGRFLFQYSPFHLIFEFGFDQRGIAERVLQKYPEWKSSFFPDYAGVERFGEVIL